MITKEDLKAKIAQLEHQKVELIANVNAHNGALEVSRGFLATIEEREKEEIKLPLKNERKKKSIK
ncbi:MAG: hypothetical protein WCE94_15190 [Candidatus Methanoperedens sp.]